MTTYTPKDVYMYSMNGNSSKLTTALRFRGSDGWYTDRDGWSALHRTIIKKQYDCICILISSYFLLGLTVGQSNG